MAVCTGIIHCNQGCSVVSDMSSSLLSCPFHLLKLSFFDYFVSVCLSFVTFYTSLLLFMGHVA